MESIQVNLEHRLPPATYLVKEEVLSKVMEFRTVTRQILSRAQGEAAEAVNIDHQRHLLIRQGDGRYLSMSAITNDQVKEALGNLAPMTKRLLGCEELRDQVATLLAAEILGKDYVKYMKHEEEVEAMTFEDKIDVCAHGRLAIRYGRPDVPCNAVISSVHGSDSSSVPSDIFGDLNLAGALATPQESDNDLDKEAGS